jgi:hypothetical protein
MRSLSKLPIALHLAFACICAATTALLAVNY